MLLAVSFGKSELPLDSFQTFSYREQDGTFLTCFGDLIKQTSLQKSFAMRDHISIADLSERGAPASFSR